MQAKPIQYVICKFYAKGYCKNGWSCAFLHETARNNAADARMDSDVTVETEPCRYFARGKCLKGSRCNFRHEDMHRTNNSLAQGSIKEELSSLAPINEDNASSSSAQLTSTNNMPNSNTESSIDEKKQHLEPSTTQLDLECSICLEFVLKQGKQFGLLPRCDHIFCLDCIRSWRQPSNGIESNIQLHHVCPVCRVKSFYIVQSAIHATGENKKRIIYEYRQRLKLIPCKYYKLGRGSCPFADRCFYLHGLQHRESRRLQRELPRNNINNVNNAHEVVDTKDNATRGHLLLPGSTSRRERITILARAIQYARAKLRGNEGQYAEYEEDYQRVQQNPELKLELGKIVAKERNGAGDDTFLNEKKSDGEEDVSDVVVHQSDNVDSDADNEYCFETEWD